MTDEQPDVPITPEEPLPSPPPERVPFWGYADLALFIGLAIPSMLAGVALVRIAMTVLHLKPVVKVAELLPEQFLGYLLLFGSLSVMFRLQYGRPFWRSLGWTEMRLSPIRVFWSGVAMAIAVVVTGAVMHMPDTSNPMKELLRDRLSMILVAIFGVTLGPLSEELAFRGFLQPLLVRTMGAIPGIALSAATFGLMHFQEYGNSWRHVVLISLAGSGFGWMRHVTGSTKASTLMHASYNALFFIALFSQGKNPAVE